MNWPTIVFLCFDTVGWVIWPVKIVPDMTYNVFGGTLNRTLLHIDVLHKCTLHCIDIMCLCSVRDISCTKPQSLSCWHSPSSYAWADKHLKWTSCKLRPSENLLVPKLILILLKKHVLRKSCYKFLSIFVARLHLVIIRKMCCFPVGYFVFHYCWILIMLLYVALS